MIAVDTNLLVYAHRRETDESEAAFARLKELAEGSSAWAVPWPCIHEFLAIVTHPRIFDPPSPLDVALGQMVAWFESPRLQLLAESPGYELHLEQLVRAGAVTGPRIHDARIAALCLHHGVSELWTADRDFSRFPALRTRNPLVGWASPFPST